jgi:hypothetical protein
MAPRPSIAVAAGYLRRLALMAQPRPLHGEDDAARELRERAMRAALYVIADKIERGGWRKGSILHPQQEQLIRAVAKLAPEDGVSLTAHDEALGRDIAQRWRLDGPNVHEHVRDLIVETRKQLRKQYRRKAGK